MGDLVHLPIVQQRPRTRGDCENGPRPCPWVSCKHHLALGYGKVLTANGSAAAHVEKSVEQLADLVDADGLYDMPHTCALDVADRGGASLDDMRAAMNLTRERMRQIVEKAIWKLQKRTNRERKLIVELGDGTPVPTPGERPTLKDISEQSTRLVARGAEREDEDDRESDDTVRGVWKLFEREATITVDGREHIADVARPVEETRLRLEVACRSVWRAYMNASIADGFERGSKDPKFTESLASVEEHLARKNAEQPEEKTMAKRWTDNERDTCTEMIIERLRERGPANPKAIADAIGRKTPAVGRLLRELRDEKRIVHNGAIGRGALYGVVGTDFNVAQGERATVPAKKRPAPPPRAAAKVTVPRVRDLEGIKVSEGFGYKLRVNGVEVECPSAASVVELVRELAS